MTPYRETVLQLGFAIAPCSGCGVEVTHEGSARAYDAETGEVHQCAVSARTTRLRGPYECGWDGVIIIQGRDGVIREYGTETPHTCGKKQAPPKERLNEGLERVVTIQPVQGAQSERTEVASRSGEMPA